MSHALSCPRHPHLALIDTAGKGRGVIATAPIAADELLEVVPVIPLTIADAERILPTHIENYVFKWEESDETGLPLHSTAVALGFISLLNHSATPNANFTCDMVQRIIRLRSARAIAANEEITIDYACDLWFEVKE